MKTDATAGVAANDVALTRDVSDDIERWEGHLNPVIRGWERRLLHDSPGGTPRGRGTADRESASIPAASALAIANPLAMGAAWYAANVWWARWGLNALAAWNAALPQANVLAEPPGRARVEGEPKVKA